MSEANVSFFLIFCPIWTLGHNMTAQSAPLHGQVHKTENQKKKETWGCRHAAHAVNNVQSLCDHVCNILRFFLSLIIILSWQAIYYFLFPLNIFYCGLSRKIIRERKIRPIGLVSVASVHIFLYFLDPRLIIDHHFVEAFGLSGITRNNKRKMWCRACICLGP